MRTRKKPFLVALALIVLLGVGVFFHFFSWSDIRNLYADKKALQRQRLEVRIRSITSDPTKYRAFHQKYQSFYSPKKTEEERERLREICRRLENDSQALALNMELATYYAWLKTVPEAKEQIDQAVGIEQRLAIIREIKEKQNRIQGRAPGGDSDQIPRDDPFEEDEMFGFGPTDSELAAHLEKMDSQDRSRLLGLPPDDFRYYLLLDYNSRKKE